MINPQFEIDRLRQTLVTKGLTAKEAEEVSNLAKQDMEVAIGSLVENAVNQAAEAGLSIGAEEFVGEIKVMNAGGSFKVGTVSGKTDFSLPPFPMLPHLLKNAKTAKDGSRYKVIPIGKKTPSSGGPKQRLLTLFEVQRDMNNQQIADVEQRKQILKEARNLTLTAGSGEFSGLAKARQLLANKREQERQDSKQPQGEIEYRTASSKQDPNNSWVLPEKKMDMTFILDEINRRLEDDIQNTVRSIVHQYEGLV